MTTIVITAEVLADPEACARLRAVLGIAGPTADERIPLVEVTTHGAPSARWVRDRRRDGEIEIYGPRGRQYVRRADLDRLTAARRERTRSGVSVAPTNVATEAAAAVADLGAARVRRARRTG